jgi:pimeloyl-ACP methyl ester carboxylesterase
MRCDEIPVSFPSIDGSLRLAGTLACPSQGGTTTRTVVLVSGTGPIDRDVTLADHALFRVMAHSLARHGIASLRFDKRGVGESEGSFATARPDDFIADVLGARDYLIEREQLRPEEVGFVGHSEGGEVALSAAARAPETAFCVALATPLLNGTDNLVRAFALLAHGGLERDDELDRSGMPLEAAPELQELAARLAPRIVNERTELMFGTATLSGAQFLNLLASPCLDTSLGWEPARVVPHVVCPVLLIYGAKDVQAPGPENLAAARALVDGLGRSNWTIHQLPDMNHAFQRCTTGMPDEYASLDHVMAEEVVEEVATWIRSITANGPTATNGDGRGR